MNALSCFIKHYEVWTIENVYLNIDSNRPPGSEARFYVFSLNFLRLLKIFIEVDTTSHRVKELTASSHHAKLLKK